MMAIALCIIYIAVFSILILKWKIFSTDYLSKRLIILFFLLKILAGLTLNFIYSNHYSDKENADIYKYFNDSKYIHESLKENPLDYLQLITGYYFHEEGLNRYLKNTKHWKYQSEKYAELTSAGSSTFSNNRTITKFNAIVRIFSFGNISVHVIFMCFLSLIGCVLFFKSYSSLISGNAKKLLYYVIFLTPSILLWSSGILKEGLITLGMGVLIYCIFKLKDENKWRLKYILFFGLSLLLLFITKYYIALIILPISIVFMINTTSKKQTLLKYGLFTLMAIGSLFVIETFYPKFSVLNRLKEKQNEQVRFAKGGYYYVKFNQKNIQQLVRFHNNVSELSNPLKINGNKDSLLIQIKPGLYYQNLNNGFNSQPIKTDSLFTCYFLDSFPKANSYYPIDEISTNVSSTLLIIPKAILTIFTKPFFVENKSVFFILCSIENLCILICLLVILFKFKFNNQNLNAFLFNIVFVAQLYAIIGLTCPVIGGLVRYKVPGLTLLLISFVLAMYKKPALSSTID